METKHFKLRKDLSIEIKGGVKLYRIEATEDISGWSVKRGDVGGFVQCEENLNDSSWIKGDAKVYGNAKVFGDSLIYDNAEVYGDAQIDGMSRIHGNAIIRGNAHCLTNADVEYGTLSGYNDCVVIEANTPITITKHGITIFGHFLKHKDWRNMTDQEFNEEFWGHRMTQWWRRWKPVVSAICEANRYYEKEEK